LIVHTPNSLYHYTTKYGRLAIIESGVLRPSLPKSNRRDVLYGSGQYFTNISPEMIACKSITDMTLAQIESGQISLLQLSRRIMAGTQSLEKFCCFIQFDVSTLIIEDTENPCIYLHRSDIDIDISNLIIRSGDTLI
jgi:hypothetical protein